MIEIKKWTLRLEERDAAAGETLAREVADLVSRKIPAVRGRARLEALHLIVSVPADIPMAERPHWIARAVSRQLSRTVNDSPGAVASGPPGRIYTENVKEPRK